MTISEMIAERKGIEVHNCKEQEDQFNEFINPAMKEIALQSWLQSWIIMKNAVGFTMNESVSLYEFEKWFNKEL